MVRWTGLRNVFHFNFPNREEPNRYPSHLRELAATPSTLLLRLRVTLRLRNFNNQAY